MEFIEILKAIFFGIVQGITEWLPISSTGHMILLDEFIKMDVSKEFMDLFLVVVQLGSILAVVVLFFHKLNPFSPKKTVQERRDTLSLWGKVIVAAIPAGIIGLLFGDEIQASCYNFPVVAVALIVYGIAFILIENKNRNRRPLVKDFNKLNYRVALVIGIFQILALIPGTSRSGSTILGAILIGCSRYVAAEFSFFLAIPMMLGASGLELIKAGFDFTSSEWVILIVGMVVAFVVSLFAIKFLMNFIKKHNFKAFGYYRIILGAILLIYFVITLI